MEIITEFNLMTAIAHISQPCRGARMTASLDEGGYHFHQFCPTPALVFLFSAQFYHQVCHTLR